jgi:two-component system, NarL family, response regulator DevR
VECILLVEDHTSFRQTLALVLDGEPGFEVVAQAGTVAEARELLDSLGCEIDASVFDLSLPDGEGTELIRELREANLDFRALVLTASFERTDFARAIEAGAAGAVHKTAAVEEIVGAVRRLMAGEALLSKDEVAELLDLANSTREQEQEGLSRRERFRWRRARKDRPP